MCRLSLLAVVKSLNETSTRYCSYLSAALIYIISTAQGRVLNGGQAFALLAAFSYFGNNVLATGSSGLLYFFEFLASLRRTHNILSLPDRPPPLPLLSTRSSRLVLRLS